MAFSRGPKIVKDSLVLYLDAANEKGISPLGNNSFNGAKELAKNLVSAEDAVRAINGVHIGNLNFYTVFAIDYPEVSVDNGDANSRHGITPGLNVRSGDKLFGYSRSLHYSVYDNVTNSWVKHTMYDSYLGTGPVDTFVSEYATTVANYPNAVHVISGSHKDTHHTTEQYNILRDLGAPLNVDSIIGFSSPEWILVGKPNLGAGNAYGWVFQNYTTNSSKIAHLNFGLPIYGNQSNYFLFDGLDDGLVLLGPSTKYLFTQHTYEAWIKTSGLGNNSQSGIFGISYGLTINLLPGGSLNYLIYSTDSNRYILADTTVGVNLFDNKWHHILCTRGDSTYGIYIDGVLNRSGSNIPWSGTNIWAQMNAQIGNDPNNVNLRYKGAMTGIKIYNRGLTSEEVLQNYNATKGKFK